MKKQLKQPLQNKNINTAIKQRTHKIIKTILKTFTKQQKP